MSLIAQGTESVCLWGQWQSRVKGKKGRMSWHRAAKQKGGLCRNQENEVLKVSQVFRVCKTKRCVFLKLCEVTVDPCLLTCQSLPTKPSLNSKISISENCWCPRKKINVFCKMFSGTRYKFWNTRLIIFLGVWLLTWVEMVAAGQVLLVWGTATGGTWGKSWHCGWWT